MEPKKTVRIYQDQPISRPSMPKAGKNTVEIHVKGGSVHSGSNNTGAFTYGTPVIKQAPPAGDYPTVTLTGKSSFSGTAGGLIGWSILIYFVIIFTLGLGTPWAICRMEKWRADHTTLDGLQVVFDGKARHIFWRYIGWEILTVLTLGIFSFWMIVKLQRWITENTYLEAC